MKTTVRIGGLKSWSTTTFSIGRRGRMEIAAAIIRVARGGALKTQLVYQANLNFRIVKGHLARLLDQGLLQYDPPRYFATEKGITYLASFERLVSLES